MDEVQNDLKVNNEEEGAIEVEINQNANIQPSQCSNERCVEMEKKYKDLMKLYLKATHRFSELDHKYSELLRMKTRIGPPDTNVAEEPSNDIFSLNELKYLQSIPLSKTADSTFILKCLDFAYKSDPSVLRCKTLKGKAEVTQYDDDGNIKQQAKRNPWLP